MLNVVTLSFSMTAYSINVDSNNPIVPYVS